jgi:hypothetical protein
MTGYERTVRELAAAPGMRIARGVLGFSDGA